MDINAKVKWTPGMVLSSKLLDNVADLSEQRYVAVVRALMGDRYGLMPGYPIDTKGFFVKDSFEIPCLKCTALLPSGLFVSIEEAVVFKMPSLSSGVYYFCVGIGSGHIEYESCDTAMTRPEYVYSVKNEDEVKDCEMLPIARFKVADGVCSIDSDYIPPCLLISEGAGILDICANLSDLLEKIVSHPNLREGDGKYNIYQYGALLKSVGKKHSVFTLAQIVSWLVTALEYYVFIPQGVKMPIPKVAYYDIQKWLGDVEKYLAQASKVLDDTHIEDTGIDVEALKQQIEADMYDKLSWDIKKTLLTKLHLILTDDMDKSIAEKLKDFLDGTFRTQTYDSIVSEIVPKLHTELYDSLYNDLYNVLFNPGETEEEEFTPMM